MKSGNDETGKVRFARLNINTRSGGLSFHRKAAALGSHRGAQSVVSNERRKRASKLGRLRAGVIPSARRPRRRQEEGVSRGAGGTRRGRLSRLARRGTRGQASSLTAITRDDDRDMNERIGDKSKQVMQTTGGGILRNSVKGGTKATIRTTRWAARTSARTAPNSARTARKAAGASVRTATALTRQTISMATRAAASIGAAVGSMSLPIIMAVVAFMAVVAVVTALFSWLPGAANDQNTDTSSANYALADDYPYKGHYNDGTSPLGYEYGNCTDFAAWRVNRDAGVSQAPWKYQWAQLTPLGGNGGQWGLSGNLPGWTTTTTPSPGDLISIPAGMAVLGASAGPYGHVGYIAQVDNGTVTIENYGGGKYFLTTPTTSQLAAYLKAGQAVIKHNPLGRASSGTAGGTGTDAKSYAKSVLNDEGQYNCLVQLWDHESGWRVDAKNPSSGAYGIPQALPGSKMASAGADWKTNGVTQVKWGLSYIRSRPDYGTPCAAWSKWQSRSPHWY